MNNLFGTLRNHWISWLVGHGLSQTYVAELMGVARQRIHQIAHHTAAPELTKEQGDLVMALVKSNHIDDAFNQWSKLSKSKILTTIAHPINKDPKKRGRRLGQVTYSDSMLLEKLATEAQHLGHTPTMAEFASLSEKPNAGTYILRFGTWTQACELAGLIPNSRGAAKKAKIPEKKQLDYTNHELLVILKHEAKSIGRTPQSVDFLKKQGLPPLTLYFNRFGSWTKACKLAGVMPQKMSA